MLLKEGKFRFENFVLDTDEGELLKDGSPVQLPPKALNLLSILVVNRGRIVEKDRLMEEVWGDTFVEEGNLAYTVRLLRRSLGDDADTPKYIETIPRRGYRFVAAVTLDDRDGEREHTNRAQVPPVESAAGGFVGRTKQLSEVIGLLCRNETRLITLTGTGGTGKTSLAKEVGRRVQEKFPDGVFYVELESVTDPSLLATLLANSLGVVGPAHRSMIEVLTNHFRGKSAVLILDNFEQILPAGPMIAQLVRDATPLKVLITSREPLKLKIETEYNVPPFSLPSAAVDESAIALMRYEAIEFFVDRARRARPDNVTFEKDLQTIASICRRLDGLPLALELAAARAKILSPSEILSKLEDSLGLLTGGALDAPTRQQTMRATIAWSYDLLSESEKLVFARLAIFEGGFTFTAAEEVLSKNGIDDKRTSILDAITSLTDKGLLIAESVASGQRFRMLVVVREFALERLHENFENASLTARSHAEYFLKLAEDAEPRLQSPDVASWMEQLETDHDNLRATIKWSFTAEPVIGARVAKALRLYWGLRGYTREAQYWYAEILKSESIPDEYRWSLLHGLANVKQFTGELEFAGELYHESLSVAEALGNQILVAQAKRGIAATLYILGDTAAARSIVLEALEISQSQGDDFGAAAATARLGDLALKDGHPEEACQRTAEALETFRKLGFAPGVASKLMNLGMAEIACGDLTSANEHLAEGLDIATDIGDYITIRLALEGLSFLLVETGHHYDAARLSSATDRMGDKIDHVLEPAEKQLRKIYLAKLKENLTEQEFEEACSLGHKMTRPEAIELALRLMEKKPKKVGLIERRLARRGM